MTNVENFLLSVSKITPESLSDEPRNDMEITMFALLFVKLFFCVQYLTRKRVLIFLGLLRVLP